MGLDECISKHTHRQFVAWIDWLDEQINEPSRTDYYLMQIARQVALTFGGRKADKPLSKYVIKFRTSRRETLEDKKERAAQSKKAWISALFGSRSKDGETWRQKLKLQNSSSD